MKKSLQRAGFEAGDLCSWCTVSRWSHACVRLASLFALLALSHNAFALERGAIGGALDVGRGELGFVGVLRAGISAWYRLEPTLALGLANVSISRYSGGSHRLRPAFELEMGPELRIFFEPQHDSSRATLFVRARGTFSVIPRDEDVERASSAFFGYGFALGFEG